MSELKAYRVKGVTLGDTHDVYLKSEADKEISRQKYKRCLAMAKRCRLHDEFTQLESERLGLPQRAIFMEYRRKAIWWHKWHKRWIKLAERFKQPTEYIEKDLETL